MKHNRLMLSTLILSTFVGFQSAQGATIVVPENGTYLLGASMTDPLNKTTTTIDLREGATLCLTNTPGAAALDFQLKVRVCATNGTAYLDLSAAPSANYLYSGSLLCGSTGNLIVKGKGGLVFGRRMDATAVDFPLFDAPSLAFEMPGDGLVFTNCVTLRAAPANYAVAAGTLLALRGSNTLAGHSSWNAAAGSHGTLTLSDFDVMPLEPTSIPEGATVCVNDGRKLYAKPCNVHPNDIFGWAGCRGTNRFDLVLNGNGTLNVLSRNDYVLEGSVSGDGRIVRLVANNAMDVSGTAGTMVKGSLAGFSGEVAVAGPGLGDSEVQDQRIRFLDFGPEVSFRSVLYTTSRATVSFEGAGTISVASVSAPASARGNVLLASNGLTFNVASFSGAVMLAGAGSFNVETIAPQSMVGVRGKTQTTFGTFGAGSSLLAEAENGVDSVVFENATSLPFINATSPVTVTVPDGCAVAGIADNVTLRVGADTSVVSASGGTFDLRGGTLTLDAFLNESNSAKVLLWLDASQASSFQSLTNNGVAVTFTNDLRLVDEWHDCRAGQTEIYARNDHANLENDRTVYPRIYPYIVPGGCNGKDYVSMGKYNADVTGGKENRRFCFWQNGPDVTLSDAKFVIMVFGSQFGGGASILSDKNNSYRREKGGESLNYPIMSSSSAAKGTDLWLDGVKTNATTALLNGGWQVVSINLGSTGLYSLGQPGTYPAEASGQNYAEVIVLSVVPTEGERVAIEKYLAVKWGLQTQYLKPTARLSGTGRVVLSSDAELAGTFRGTVDLNGKRAGVSALPLPPTDADVPSSGRVCWFDPELEGALRHATPGRPLAVSTLYGRDNAGLANASSDYCLVGSYADSANDRRPWVSRSARGSGPERNWLDFTDIYASDTLRNVLRIQKVGDATDQRITYRSGFYVLDSSRGGGSLLLNDIWGDSGIVHRADGSDAAYPIWSKGITAGQGLYLKQGANYLDGMAVDGSTHGFFGRPEVLSFVASQNLTNLKVYMGYINATPNREIIGETLFYNRVLSDAERQTVEAYLMNKWLGVAPAGYSDLRGATFTGSGVLACASQAALPKFDAGFTGQLALSAATYEFSIDARATEPVAGAITVPNGSVAIPANAVMRVSFPTRVRSGNYTLVSATTVGGAEDLQLEVSGSTGAHQVRLNVTSAAVVLEVVPNGTRLLIR